MIERTLAIKMISLAQKFQVITLTGPRQSGKTTLVRAVFPALPYASLEEPDIRQIALTDPRGFLSNYPNPDKPEPNRENKRGKVSREAWPKALLDKSKT